MASSIQDTNTGGSEAQRTEEEELSTTAILWARLAQLQVSNDKLDINP